MAGKVKDAEVLREAILQDPDVILEDRDVMRALIQANGAQPMARNVVDLRGVLVERLETRLDRLEETHRSVIAAAYENLAGTNQIHRAALAVLEPTRFSEFLRVLSDDVPKMLAVDMIRICLESEGAETGLGEVIVSAPPGAVDAYMDLGRPSAHRRVMLREAFPEANIVYGEAARWVCSEALIRLDLGGRDSALLVFGAEDPNRFSPDQGGDLLAFFGGVVERAIRRFLAES